jgi:hypothetical protein
MSLTMRGRRERIRCGQISLGSEGPSDSTRFLGAKSGFQFNPKFLFHPRAPLLIVDKSLVTPSDKNGL